MTLPNPFEEYLPSAGDVGAIFAEEVASFGGTLVDVVEVEGRLFGRALLGQVDDVTPGDTIHGGIAIRADGKHVAVHAYTHRQVCVNGAISVVPTDQIRVERAIAGTPTELVTPVNLAIRDAMRRCAESPAFDQAIVRMRLATQMEARMVMPVFGMLLHTMALHAPPGWRDSVWHDVMQRFVRDGERSLFGAFNAVTATARDEPDPARRWALQEIGGRLLERATMPQRAQALRALLDGAEASGPPGRLVGVGASDD
jgi:hypothetical protein